jgi:hypothetical protein
MLWLQASIVALGGNRDTGETPMLLWAGDEWSAFVGACGWKSANGPSKQRVRMFSSALEKNCLKDYCP